MSKLYNMNNCMPFEMKSNSAIIKEAILKTENH